jgi:hypothetical protein
MNQIIGPKLSKSETFYESLLTACLLKMVCWERGFRIRQANTKKATDFVPDSVAFQMPVRS